MSHRILIVDDEANHRRSLSISLRMEGFEVLEAADGEHALNTIADQPVDIVICDLMMPRVDGLELARRLRFAHPSTRVILMSAYHLTRAQIERACAAGGTSIHSTGSSPGFISEAVPIVLSSIQRRIEELVIEEYADLSQRDSPELLFSR